LDSHRAKNSTWEDFAKELGKALSLSGDVGGPPEVATVLRHFQRHIKHAKTAEDAKASLEEEAESYKRQITALEKQSRDTSTLLVRAKRESSELEKKVDSAQQRCRTLESQQGIWQREAESLRELINTFDDMIPGTSSTSDSRAATAALVIGLAAAKEELKVVTDDRDTMNGKLQKLQVEMEDLQKEHERVLDKFSKLRDALMEERANADKAQDRAIHAELLAGKGAFNADQSRALHMDKNPLIDAIRERYQAEIYSLRRKLEQMTGQKIPEGVLPSPEGVDPNKLHQRLKESFKEQINMFREGVYLITGYKIDMIHTHNGSSFRVRSVYAEREEDYLEFYWPKGVKEPKALDLGATDFAKVLSTTHSYQYLKKYDSCPAFVASAQLSQFEKCTIVQFG
jgi:mitotic spindle assembly checkpoint protein MAD1